jgi:hypothetical protein
MQIVTFYSDRFSLTPLPDAINDVLGHDLAAWLLAGLRGRGYDADDVIGEDYGYGFWLRIAPSQFWVHAGQYASPGDGEPLPQWLVGITDDPGCLWLRRARARPSPERKLQLARDIHTILRGDPGITRIEWWARDVGVGEARGEP